LRFWIWWYSHRKEAAEDVQRISEGRSDEEKDVHQQRIRLDGKVVDVIMVDFFLSFFLIIVVVPFSLGTFVFPFILVVFFHLEIYLVLYGGLLGIGHGVISVREIGKVKQSKKEVGDRLSSPTISRVRTARRPQPITLE
jgi:hypothetical protein